jgi:hypothetical protein
MSLTEHEQRLIEESLHRQVVNWLRWYLQTYPPPAPNPDGGDCGAVPTSRGVTRERTHCARIAFGAGPVTRRGISSLR